MASSRARAYLSMARFLAAKSTSRNKHGAVIEKGGRVLAVGFNKDRNHPRVCSPEHVKSGCSVHAEAAALREAGDSAKGANIYVARVNNQGLDRDSKPCPRCAALIVAAGIRKVVYTTSEGSYLTGL